MRPCTPGPLCPHCTDRNARLCTRRGRCNLHPPCIDRFHCTSLPPCKQYRIRAKPPQNNLVCIHHMLLLRTPQDIHILPQVHNALSRCMSWKRCKTCRTRAQNSPSHKARSCLPENLVCKCRSHPASIAHSRCIELWSCSEFALWAAQVLSSCSSSSR